MDRLPAKRAEDTLLTHDYMSVAVEFDDGRDLSYYWSVALPNETSYRSCDVFDGPHAVRYPHETCADPDE